MSHQGAMLLIHAPGRRLDGVARRRSQFKNGHPRLGRTATLMTAPSREAWARLGKLLEARRVELSSQYRNRTLFCQERDIDYRLCYDLETGARSNYRRPTLRAVESAYVLVPGSLDDTLAGGPLVPAQGPLPQIRAQASGQRDDGRTISGLTEEEYQIVRAYLDGLRAAGERQQDARRPSQNVAGQLSASGGG